MTPEEQRLRTQLAERDDLLDWLFRECEIRTHAGTDVTSRDFAETLMRQRAADAQYEIRKTIPR